MRLIVPALLLAMTLAGCTGTPDTQPFVPTCPTWTQGPGAPGAQVASSRHISENDGQLKEFHLEGSFVHHPPTGKYELEGATLDFVHIKFPAVDANGNPNMYAVDGTYTIRAYRTDPSTPSVEKSEDSPNGYTEDDRGTQLFFRDISKPTGKQYVPELTIEPNAELEWAPMEYRIEFAGSGQPVNPDSLWIEYEFDADHDNDDTTPSQGGFKYTVTFWYRNAC